MSPINMGDIRPADSFFPEPRKEERVRLPPQLPVDDPRDFEVLPVCDVSLVGERLLGRKSFPVAALIFGLAALFVLVLAAATGNIHLLVFAAFPGALGLAFLLARPAAFAGTITAEGLEISRPRLNIAFRDIQEISAPERRRTPAAFAIHVLHAEGFITIPARLNVPSEELYRFLVNQPLNLTDDRSVPAVLANFVRIQESLYGPDRVWVYRARPSLPAGKTARYGVALGVAVLATGLIWLAAGLAMPGQRGRPGTAWFAVGMTFAVIGAILAFACVIAGLIPGNPRIKNWRQACLVLSPGGIALVQGHLKGELKWQEVRDIKLRERTLLFSWGSQDNYGPGLILTVAGATILLADIYHRPLAHIHHLTRRFWPQ